MSSAKWRPFILGLNVLRTFVKNVAIVSMFDVNYTMKTMVKGGLHKSPLFILLQLIFAMQKLSVGLSFNCL